MSSPLGEYSTHVIRVCWQLDPLKHNICPPSAHHCWVDRGCMEWEVNAGDKVSMLARTYLHKHWKKIKVAICNHQAGCLSYLWPDV